MLCAQIGVAHHTRDAMLAAGLSRFTQIEEDPSRTVDVTSQGLTW
jgi:hypothetical protein